MWQNLQYLIFKSSFNQNRYKKVASNRKILALDLEAVAAEWAGRAGKAHFGKKTGRRSPIFFCLALLSYICFGLYRATMSLLSTMLSHSAYKAPFPDVDIYLIYEGNSFSFTNTRNKEETHCKLLSTLMKLNRNSKQGKKMHLGAFLTFF